MNLYLKKLGVNKSRFYLIQFTPTVRGHYVRCLSHYGIVS